ncbi:MAG: ABC transporter substrate-binding protein [bacterium]
MRTRRTLSLASLLAVFVLALTAAVSDAAKKPVEIRLAYGIPPLQITGLLFAKKELLTHYGKSYTLKMIYAKASSLVPPLLAAKEADVGYVSYTAFAHSIVNAKLDIKIVADLLQWGIPGWFNSFWSVRRDSGINTVKDLKGKRIAVPAFGTALDMALRVMMRRQGFEANRDYNVVEVRFPNMAGMLTSGKVDAAVLLPPWWYQPRYNKKLKFIFSPDQALGRIQALFQVARTEWLKKNPEVAKDFFEDYLKAWRWYIDPSNREEALDIIAKLTKRPRKNYAGWALTPKEYYRGPNALVNAKALQSNVDVMHKLGFLKRKLDVSKYMDMSYIEEANRRLAK